MSDQEKQKDRPDPARAALGKPHLTSQELEMEVGDSEPWDEASEEGFPADSPEHSEDDPD